MYGVSATKWQNFGVIETVIKVNAKEQRLVWTRNVRHCMARRRKFEVEEKKSVNYAERYTYVTPSVHLVATSNNGTD